jgi:ribonuclease P protein component
MLHRLANQSDFSHVMDGGAKAVSANLFLLLAKKNPFPHSRLGMVISKKAHKKAVQRNRIKRLIRESFRTQEAHFPPMDVVVLAKKGQRIESNLQVFKELDQLWRDICAKFAPPSCG